MTDHVEAYVVTGIGEGGLADWPLADDEVVIDVEACGVCHRDTGVWTGQVTAVLPGVLGHELLGRVVSAPPGAGLRPGARVAGLGNASFARRTAVPAWQITEVPDDGSLAPVMFEPLVCAVNAVAQARPLRDGPVVVVGLGLLGRLILDVARLDRSREVIGADRDPVRRRSAARAGATVVDTADEVREAMADAAVVFECSGAIDSLTNATAAMRPAGCLVIVSHYQSRSTLPASVLLDAWHRGGIAVTNAVPWTAGPELRAHIRKAGALLADGRLDLSRYGMTVFDLADTAKALTDWPPSDVFRHVVTA
ncbi:MAG: alcohol dehydrogenase catalytic domain-containing protein [Saccharothrix sp.]|nr:alcohol dehydrogenase catalytic domain-containing protein [Saccharothrix sp.]